MLNKKKVLKAVKGFTGRAKNCIRIARNRYEKSLLHAYRGRKLKARQFRSLWITRINAASRLYQLPYRRFIHGLGLLNVALNRKMISELAVSEPYSFRSLVEQVKLQTSLPTNQFPSHGLLQSSLVINKRVPEWKTHRFQQNQQTQQFLQQYYKNQQLLIQQQKQPITSTTTQTPTEAAQQIASS